MGGGINGGGGVSQQEQAEQRQQAKKARFVFTDIQRRTLKAIFKETPRPTKDMQTTIADQLALEVSTVANFFMNARRRSHDKWLDEKGHSNLNHGGDVSEEDDNSSN